MCHGYNAKLHGYRRWALRSNAEYCSYPRRSKNYGEKKLNYSSNSRKRKEEGRTRRQNPGSNS